MNDLWLVYVHAPTEAARPGLAAVERVRAALMRQGRVVNAINVPLGSSVLGVPGQSVRKTFIAVEQLGRRWSAKSLREFLEEHACRGDRFILFGEYGGKSRTGYSVPLFIHWEWALDEEQLFRKLKQNWG